nr:MAG TPA: hypothetical protein [Caudoviricetes sp.]
MSNTFFTVTVVWFHKSTGWINLLSKITVNK